MNKLIEWVVALFVFFALAGFLVFVAFPCAVAIAAAKALFGEGDDVHH